MESICQRCVLVGRNWSVEGRSISGKRAIIQVVMVHIVTLEENRRCARMGRERFVDKVVEMYMS